MIHTLRVALLSALEHGDITAEEARIAGAWLTLQEMLKD